MGKIATFRALDGADRIASFEAALALLVMRALVRFVPPWRWPARFGGIGRQSPVNPAPADIATVRRVRLAMARVRRNARGPADCLAQALAARRMLERRGIAAALHLGVADDAAASPRFHAWLKVGDEWVTGHCDERSYRLFASPG